MGGASGKSLATPTTSSTISRTFAASSRRYQRVASMLQSSAFALFMLTALTLTAAFFSAPAANLSRPQAVPATALSSHSQYVSRNVIGGDLGEERR